jgi:AbrB family looped-hinge helix DNA binding protein
MVLKIDKGGRVTLPKSLREQFGLKAGENVEAVETAEGILFKSKFKPVTKGVSQVRKSRHETLAEEMRKAWGL